MSKTIGVRKSCAIVMALCRLHNFCINMGDESPLDSPPLDEDEAYAAMCSGIELQATATNQYEPTGLIRGGEHFDDITRNVRRRVQRAAAPAGVNTIAVTILPQQLLHDSVVNQGLQRPMVKFI
jgi:hypothetical protein